MPNLTQKLENEARERLVLVVGEHLDLPGLSLLLAEEFGVDDTARLVELPFSRLLEITDFVEDLFVSRPTRRPAGNGGAREKWLSWRTRDSKRLWRRETV